MADLIREYSTSNVVTHDIAQSIEELVAVFKSSRRQFERRWYDNNFFDDGHHFRYLSRSTNKIVDLSERSTIYTPQRAIPKASKQIRGVANLLVVSDPTAVIYPEKVSVSNYPPVLQADPNTGQQTLVQNPEYQKALDEAKRIARQIGHWIGDEMKSQDLVGKLAQMIILTAKHGVSYLQVWPDAIEEAIRTQVYDAFDIYLMGSLTSIYDSPAIIKATPMLISVIKANENFDTEQLKKISPDNKQASSEIKEAYMKSRYGQDMSSDTSATLIVKEAFIKEYIGKNNTARIRMQEDGEKILKGRKDGDPVIRQVFSAGGVWLRDKYTNLPDYPFVDFRMEPGPIYQVPLIERFIPSNKSLDTVVSRIERYTHTMVTGTWLKRTGEQFKMSNVAGGQVVEYDATAPVQANIAPIPNFVFNFVNLLTTFIEEQGVSLSTLSKIPPGVRAAAAIESLKESEYAGLVISTRQLKGTIKRIAEKMLDIADNHFVSPQTVYYLEKGEPKYFDIIGNNALQQRKQLNIETPAEVIPIKKDYHVDIEVESGLGFTREGQRASMLELSNFMRGLAKEGYLPPEAIKVVLGKLLEAYKFGSTAEFMEALDAGTLPMSEEEIMKMKVAMAEVLKDTGVVGPEAQNNQVMATKVGMMETMKDLGGGAKNAQSA